MEKILTAAEKAKRNSGIELLKIIAVIMITFAHFLPYYGNSSWPSYINMNKTTESFQRLILVFFLYWGQLGNGIFIICSSYFLLDSKKVKANKVLYILADCAFFSIAWLIVFLLCGYKFPTSTIIAQIFPVTFAQCWFITCYIVFYLIHPLLAAAANSMTQKGHAAVVILSFLMYGVVHLILGNKYYYSHLLGFCVLFMATAYVKKYLTEFSKSKKANAIGVIIGFVGIFLSIIITNWLGLRFGISQDRLERWNFFINPLVVLFGICALNLFKNLKFESNFVNIVSSASLLVYIFSENILFRRNFKPLIYKFIYESFGYDYIVLWVILIAITAFVISVIVSLTYKFTVGKLLHKLCDFICKILKKPVDKMLGLFMKIK